MRREFDSPYPHKKSLIHWSCYNHGMEFKVIISSFVIFLTLAAYIPYLRDILRGKTKPHIFSWLSGSMGATIAFFLQVLGGAGVGAWPMAAVALACIPIFLLSFKYGTKDIVQKDVYMIALSLIALAMWLVANEPVISIILLTVSQIMAFVPTIRKTWHDPHSETISFYQISTVRHGLAIVALEQTNILTALYPAAWLVTNALIVAVIFYRRKQSP